VSAVAAGLRPWFEDYLAAFNRADFTAFGAWYADDVIFHGQAAQLVGRDAVLDFYRQVREYLDERVDLLTFVAAPDGTRIAAELRTTLVALRDWPEMPTGPMRAGETRERLGFAMYDIAGGQFTRIRTARFSQAAWRRGPGQPPGPTPCQSRGARLRRCFDVACEPGQSKPSSGAPLTGTGTNEAAAFTSPPR